MSAAGAAFLRQWFEKNLSNLHQPIADDRLVTALSRRCFSEAGAEGLVPGELEEDFGPLETLIRESIENSSGDSLIRFMRFGIN